MNIEELREMGVVDLAAMAHRLEQERDAALLQVSALEKKHSTAMEVWMTMRQRLEAEARGAMDAHREAVASNDRMIRERDDALRLNGELREKMAEIHQLLLAPGTGPTPEANVDRAWGIASGYTEKRIDLSDTHPIKGIPPKIG